MLTQKQVVAMVANASAYELGRMLQGVAYEECSHSARCASLCYKNKLCMLQFRVDYFWAKLAQLN